MNHRGMAIRAIMRKDLSEVLRTPLVMAPMIILPILFSLLMPVAMILIIKLIPDTTMVKTEDLAMLLHGQTLPAGLATPADQFLWLMLNQLFLPLFLIVPVMTTTIIAVNGIVGERERKTLETLLYAPLDNRDFLLAKLLAGFVPGMAVGWGGFLLLFASANLAYWPFTGRLLVDSPAWIPTLLALMPALTLLALSVSLLVSLKAKTFMEAQQLASLVVLPIVALVYTQLAGIVTLTPLTIILISAGVVAACLGIMRFLAPRLTREAMISRL